MPNFFQISLTNPLLRAVAVLGALAGIAALVILFGGSIGGASAAKFKRSVSLAVKSLWLHKLRSFLSVLGIIIGTSAVISLMSFGEGSMQDALEDIKRQGATNIIIRSVKPSDDSATAQKSFVTVYGLTKKDIERFRPVRSGVRRVVPLRVFPSEARHLERLVNSRVIGTIPQYSDVNKFELAGGRFLTESDERDMRNYCILGSEAADKLFPFENPLDKVVQIRGF